MRFRARVPGALIGLGLLAAIALGTRAPFELGSPSRAALRLAWRAHGEAALQCRRPSAEELARLPVHMRREEICERRLPTFRLVVEIDGARALAESVAPSGAAGDRAAVVLRELPLAPGAHELNVTFEPEQGGAAAKRLSRRIHVRPGEVALVMEDPHTRELVVRGP
ncbi:MAG TPA: hypothetical protein VFT98_22660 [Myxococcota bacterium]|nr:hypothetical protein [Myxococcota bacterium]